MSKSHYSLVDQTIIDDFYYSDVKTTTSKDKLDLLKSTVSSLKDEHGLLGIVDIVLNHTANNTSWIQDHPEACYSTEMVPRLWPAWLLDAELA